MDKEQVYGRVARYFDGQSSSPIIVDVPNEHERKEFIKHFAVAGTSLLNASDFCPEDEGVQWDKVSYYIANISGKYIFLGLDDFLRLEGREVLGKRLRRLIDVVGVGKFVILTVGCSDFLSFPHDIRLHSSGKVSFLTGNKEHLKSLYFMTPGLTSPDVMIKGLDKISTGINIPGDVVIVETYHKSFDFPQSLYDIKDFDTKYRILAKAFPVLNSFDENFGTEDQWNFLDSQINSFPDGLDIAYKGFGGKTGIASKFSQFGDFDTDTKWFYLLLLKLYGCEDNKYLADAARNSEILSAFPDHIYQDILEFSPKNQCFAEIYKDRKLLLRNLKTNPEAAAKFCKMVWSKEEDAIYYLTDTSTIEKETIIEYLSKYGKQLGRKEVISRLEKVYPALAIYLSDYSYGIPLLDKYFKAYKFDKLTNSISDEMRTMVEEQAVKREYNSMLNPRSLIIDSLEVDGCELYFMDAMGGEYLSYLQTVFFENGFNFSAQLARCELPSITSVNKEFIEHFKHHGCKINSRKDLDELKHEGGDSYDYENTKLPIHMIQELDIIDRLVYHLKASLDKGNRVFIIADHGTSRLAVINEQENQFELSEKGKHSGRCCPKSDTDEKPENATESNDFWCLANYDRFKGGRKALVEVHGGATLEEITVPIIEVSKQEKKIAVALRSDGPLFRSMKQSPILKIFIEKDSKNVVAEVEGIRYQSIGSPIPYEHSFDLTCIKKAGYYKANIYCDDVLIAKDLEFEVANRGARERSFF